MFFTSIGTPNTSHEFRKFSQKFPSQRRFKFRSNFSCKTTCVPHIIDGIIFTKTSTKIHTFNILLTYNIRTLVSLLKTYRVPKTSKSMS